MSRRWLLPTLTAVIAGVYFSWGRGLPLPLALIVALAAGAFVYTAIGTAARLRHELAADEPRPDEDAAGAAPGGVASAADGIVRRGLLGRSVAVPRRPVVARPPREEDQRGQEQQVHRAGEDEPGEQ